MRRYGYLIVIFLTWALAGCNSNPRDIHPGTFQFYPGATAYWTDPLWQEQMLKAVQSAVHMPTNSPHASEAGIHGTVQFLFANGVIKNPKITVGTGDPGLDQLMLEQVASAKVPRPRGPHADEPHEFELPLDMFTPFEALQYAIYATIDYKKIYSRNALISRSTGLTTLEFDYVHSAARNIVITKSSGNRELDKLSINTVSRAELPAAPADYAGKTVHMKVIFCYNINNAPACPVANNVIAVRGVIFRRGY